MNQFKFYDTDAAGLADYDIEGEEYDALLDMCFRYCSMISMRITSDSVALPAILDNYRIPLTKNVLGAYAHYYREMSPKMRREVHLFRLSPVIFEAIRGITDSIFKWIHGWGYTNPEDPAFYRADGSIFFSSVIHEGECTLTPRCGESVESIILRGHWKKVV